MEPQPSAPSFAAPTLSGLDEASLSAAASTQDELSPRVHIESVPPKRKHPILARLKPVLTRDTALFLACLIGFVFIATAQTTTSFVVDVWWGGHKNPREFNTRLDLSVWRTVEKLWEYDAKGLAVLLALFAGVVPYLKTAAVAVAVAPPMLRRWLPTWAPVFVFNAGKWIFFDVWVAFSVVAMMQFAVQNGLVIVNGAAWADKGVFAFFGACVYSQLLSAIHLYSPPTHATSASASSDASLRDNGLASDEKTWKTAETPASMAPPARLPGATPPHVLQHSREHVQTHVPTHGVVGMNTGLPPPSPARGAVGSVPEASGSKPWHTRGLTGVKARPLPLTPSRKEQTITQGSNFSKAHAAKNTVGQETVGEEHEEEDDGVALDTHAEAADTVVAAAADVTAQRDERKEAAHPTVDAGADDGSRAPVTEEVGDYVPASHGSNAADDATGYDGNCEYEYVPDGNTLVRTPQSLAPAISSLPPPTLALGGGRAGRRKGKGRNAVGAGGAAGNQRGSEVGMCCDEAGNSSSAVSTPSASAPNSAVPSPGHSPAPAPPRSVALAASAEAVAADIAAGTVGGLAEVHATIAASANAATLAQHEQESKRRGEDDAADTHGYQSNSNSNSSSLSSPAVEEKQPQPMHGAWVSERAHPLPEPLAPLDEAARENRAAQQKSQYQQYQPRKHKPSTPSSMFAAEAEPLACDSALAPSTVMVAASRTAYDQQQPTVTRTATRAVVTPIEVAEARAQGPLTRLPPHIALLFFSAVTAAILVSLLLPVLSQSVLLMKEPRFTATPSVAGMLSAAFSAAPAANAGLAALAAVFVVAIPLVRAAAGLAAALALELLWITASKPSTKSSAMSAAEASAAGEEDDDGAAPSTGPVCRSSSEVCPRPASAAQPLGALAVARLRTRSAAAATVRLCARARALLGPWGSAEVFASALLAMASEVPRIFRNSGGGVRVGLALSAQLPLVLLLVAGAADALGGWAVLRMARTPVPVRAGLSGGVKVAGKGLWATEKEWEARTSARVAAAAAAGVGGGDGAEEEDEAEYSTRLHSESVSCSQSRSCGRTGSQETEAMTPLASTMTPIGREEMMKKGF